MVAFDVEANRSYQLNLGHPPAFDLSQPIGGDSSLYFTETKHNLSSGFKNDLEHNGGLSVFGFPISEEFTEDGYTVQYFERARFEYHPEFRGTQYEVELGLLGNQTTAGRSFGQSPAFPSGSIPALLSGDGPFLPSASNTTGNTTAACPFSVTR